MIETEDTTWEELATYEQVKDIGESSKVLHWPATTEPVPVDVAARAAEMAYRRGVTQGARYMLWRIHGRPKNGTTTPDLPGYAYARDLDHWREQGRMEGYTRAEEPPRTETPGYQTPGYATTWVYFIQDSHSGAVKIGKADRPDQRIKTLQTGAPYPLSLLGVVPADDTTEKQLHERFASAHIRGEWFQPEPALLAFINRWAAPSELRRPQRSAIDLTEALR